MGEMKILHRLPIILSILIILLAAAVRFHELGTQSLWNDEGNSYVQATRTVSQIVDNAARDIHPPGYYLLLAGWVRMMGTSEFALRSLSVLASIITVAFTFGIGRRLFNTAVGALAATIMAFNTFSIYYAQEARMYALLAMWSAAAFWLLIGWIRSDGESRRWGVALAVVNAAGLYTQYAFPFVMLAQGVIVFLWLINKKTWRVIWSYFALHVLTLVLYIPWVTTAWHQITTWPNTGESIPLGQAAAQILAYLTFGVTVGSGTSIAVLFFMTFGLIQQRRVYPWWQMMLAPALGFIPVIVFLSLGLFREANLKFLLPAQIGVALWIAQGIWSLWCVQPREPRARFIPKLAAFVGAFSLLIAFITNLSPLYTQYQRDDYRAIVQFINTDPRPDDAIILNAPGQQEVFYYYYDGDAAVYPIPRGYGGDDAATLAEVQHIIENHQRIYAVFWGTNERDPNNIVESTLDHEAYEVNTQWFGDVRLVRYVTPVQFDSWVESGVQFGETITLARYALNATNVRPGDVLQIQLQWSTSAPINQPYKVFVQMIPPQGPPPAVQRDSEPAAGLRPTTTWQVGETIIDNHALILPSDLPPSHYALIIGLYNPNDPLERLIVQSQDFLFITDILVEEGE